MANRYNVRNVQSLEKAPVQLYGRVTVGATGAPTLVALKSQGILSITRTGTGAYDIALGGSAGVDTYQRLMSYSVGFVAASGSAVASVSVTADSSANATAPKVSILCLDYAGAAVDPGNGEVMIFDMTFSNTTAI